MNAADLVARYEWAEEEVVTFANDDNASKFCDNFAWLLAEELRKALMAARMQKRAAEALEQGRRRTDSLRAAEVHPDTVPGGPPAPNSSRSGW